MALPDTMKSPRARAAHYRDHILPGNRSGLHHRALLGLDHLVLRAEGHISRFVLSINNVIALLRLDQDNRPRGRPLRLPRRLNCKLLRMKPLQQLGLHLHGLIREPHDAHADAHCLKHCRFIQRITSAFVVSQECGNDLLGSQNVCTNHPFIAFIGCRSPASHLTSNVCRNPGSSRPRPQCRSFAVFSPQSANSVEQQRGPRAAFHAPEFSKQSLRHSGCRRIVRHPPHTNDRLSRDGQGNIKSRVKRPASIPMWVQILHPTSSQLCRLTHASLLT